MLATLTHLPGGLRLGRERRPTQIEVAIRYSVEVVTHYFLLEGQAQVQRQADRASLQSPMSQDTDV